MNVVIEGLIVNAVICLEVMLIVFVALRIRKLFLESQEKESQVASSANKTLGTSNVTPLGKLKTKLLETHKEAA